MRVTLYTIELGLLFDPEYNSAVPAVAFLSIFDVMENPAVGTSWVEGHSVHNSPSFSICGKCVSRFPWPDLEEFPRFYSGTGLESTMLRTFFINCWKFMLHKTK